MDIILAIVRQSINTIRLRITLLAWCCLTMISCRQTEKSKEVMQEALDVYLSSELADSIKTEKSLELTNRALDLDNQNIPALTHKTTLLFRKKDIDGLLQTADALIKLRPEKPYYWAQKALYLELKGDKSKANGYYDSAMTKYQRYLKSDSLDFDLLMEYVGLLEITGDSTLSSETLTRMEEINFDDSQKEILHVHKAQVDKKQSFSKELLMRYWKGEITYEQVEEEIGGR